MGREGAKYAAESDHIGASESPQKITPAWLVPEGKTVSRTAAPPRIGNSPPLDREGIGRFGSVTHLRLRKAEQLTRDVLSNPGPPPGTKRNKYDTHDIQREMIGIRGEGQWDCSEP